MQVQLVLDTASEWDSLNGYIPLIKDRIGMAMSRQTLEELEGPSGRERLKEEIKNEVNAFLQVETGMKVVDVYFTEFLIQSGTTERGAL